MYHRLMRFRRSPATDVTLQRARELRRDLTIAERRGWELLRDRRMLGLKFRRQHAIGRFIVDYYCAELKLILELDGGMHNDPERAAYDAARTAWLEAHGFLVIRVRNDRLSREGLRALLSNLDPRPPSPRSGEGDGG